MGRGRGRLCGPLHPFSAPLCPGALEGETGLQPGRDVSRASMHSCAHGSSRKHRHEAPRSHGLDSEWSGYLVDRSQRPGPAQGCCRRPLGGDGTVPTWSPSGGRALCACVLVAVFVYLCDSSKGNLVVGAAGLCMLGEPRAPCPQPLPRPCLPSSRPLASQHCRSLPRKGPQATPGLPCRSPARACWGSLHASPEPGGTDTHFLLPF